MSDKLVFCRDCRHHRRRLSDIRIDDDCRARPVVRRNHLHRWFEFESCAVHNAQNHCELWQPRLTWWRRVLGVLR